MTSSPDSPTGKDVVLEGVTKSFGSTQVLHSIDLRIGAGELVTVLGPSGCGKTTALRILAGFEKPTSGQVLVGGRDVTAVPPNRRDIGMVFQAYSLFPNLSVQANVEYGLRVRRMERSRRAKRAMELLEMCGLAEFGARYPHQLSGGQQQLGITTVFVTHDQEEALSVADRVAVMQDGTIEQLDTPQAVYSKPASEFVARFVGTVTEVGVPSNYTGGALRVNAPGEGLDTLFVRPEDLTLLPEAEGTCTVVSQIYTGERTIVRASTGVEGLTVTTSVSASEATNLTPGTGVTTHVMAEPTLRVPASAKAPVPAR